MAASSASTVRFGGAVAASRAVGVAGGAITDYGAATPALRFAAGCPGNAGCPAVSLATGAGFMRR